MKKNTQKLELICILLAFCTFLFSFKNSKAVVLESNLQEAITLKKVSQKSTSNGNYSGNSVSIELQNLTNKPLKIKIPQGTLFAPADEGEQTLITVVDQFVSLTPKGKATQVIDGYCSESHDHCPSAASNFTLDQTKNSKFKQLFTYMSGKKIPSAVYQNMVWTISDNNSVSSIPNNDPVTKDLRKFLCKITDQVDEWYNSSQTRTVGKKGEIITETTDVGGNITFNCPANTIVHQEVHKATGGVVFRDEKRRTISPGINEMTFSLRVKGWEKGKYILKVMTNKNVLEEYEFVV
jgi:hypothetical protein